VYLRAESQYGSFSAPHIANQSRWFVRPCVQLSSTPLPTSGAAVASRPQTIYPRSRRRPNTRRRRIARRTDPA
jgi:hypothetical protein